jgi:hypothetical protein
MDIVVLKTPVINFEDTALKFMLLQLNGSQTMRGFQDDKS